jgi:hypothetical protein
VPRTDLRPAFVGPPCAHPADNAERGVSEERGGRPHVPARGEQVVHEDDPLARYRPNQPEIPIQLFRISDRRAGVRRWHRLVPAQDVGNGHLCVLEMGHECLRKQARLWADAPAATFPLFGIGITLYGASSSRTNAAAFDRTRQPRFRARNCRCAQTPRAQQGPTPTRKSTSP